MLLTVQCRCLIISQRDYSQRRWPQNGADCISMVLYTCTWMRKCSKVATSTLSSSCHCGNNSHRKQTKFTDDHFHGISNLVLLNRGQNCDSSYEWGSPRGPCPLRGH